MIEINIAKDFSETPGGRKKKDGNFSGEEFRNKLLSPKYKDAKDAKESLIINLDGCFGFPSSFIDESFGGLARELNDNGIFKDISFVSNDQPSLVNYIEKCIKEALG
jgi:hypothetical protein